MEILEKAVGRRYEVKCSCGSLIGMTEDEYWDRKHGSKINLHCPVCGCRTEIPVKRITCKIVYDYSEMMSKD